MLSPHVRELETVLDSGFRTVDSGFHLCQWDSDSGFQSLVRLRHGRN